MPSSIFVYEHDNPATAKTFMKLLKLLERYSVFYEFLPQERTLDEAIINLEFEEACYKLTNKQLNRRNLDILKSSDLNFYTTMLANEGLTSKEAAEFKKMTYERATSYETNLAMKEFFLTMRKNRIEYQGINLTDFKKLEQRPGLGAVELRSLKELQRELISKMGTEKVKQLFCFFQLTTEFSLMPSKQNEQIDKSSLPIIPLYVGLDTAEMIRIINDNILKVSSNIKIMSHVGEAQEFNDTTSDTNFKI